MRTKQQRRQTSRSRSWPRRPTGSPWRSRRGWRRSPGGRRRQRAGAARPAARPAVAAAPTTRASASFTASTRTRAASCCSPRTPPPSGTSPTSSRTTRSRRNTSPSSSAGPQQTEGDIDAAARAATRPTRSAWPSSSTAAGPRGRRWKVEETFRGFALLRCFPKTGKTHQIRVHLKHVGLPLAVDPLYNRPRAGRAEPG